MNTVKFVASELAIVTGDNKYEKPNKVVDSVLNRSGIVKKYIPKSKIEEIAQELSPDRVYLNSVFSRNFTIFVCYRFGFHSCVLLSKIYQKC